MIPVPDSSDYHRDDAAADISDATELLLIRADYLVRAGDVEHAVETYEKVLGVRPGCLDAWIGLGVAYLEQSRLTDAERAFHNALIKSPNCQRAAIGMALVHSEGGRLEDALTLLRLAESMK